MESTDNAQWKPPQFSQSYDLDRRFQPIQPRLVSSPTRPNSMQALIEAVKRFVPRMPLGWIRPVGESPTDATDVARCEETYQEFDENLGSSYGICEETPLSGEEFFEACWAAFKRGRSPGAGIQDKIIKGIALEGNPVSMCGPDALKLKPYQLADTGRACEIERDIGGSLNAHGMGTGKTITGLAQIETSRARMEAQGQAFGTCLIVAPASLISQWIEDLTKNLPQRRVYNYSQQRTRRLSPAQIEKEFDYIVCSYDKVNLEYRDSTTMARHQHLRLEGKDIEEIELTDRELIKAGVLGKSTESRKTQLVVNLPDGALHHVFFEKVLCDEAHRGKGDRSLAHSLYALLRKNTILLTATPQQNGYQDWFFLIKMARFAPFNNDKESFKQHFVFKKGHKNDWAAMSTQRQCILAIMMRAFMIRRMPYSLFNGVPAQPPIPYIEHDPVRVEAKSRASDMYPHHVQLGGISEEECQQGTKHLWNQYIRMQNPDGTTEFVRQDYPGGKISNTEDGVVVETAMRARQAAVHPLILLSQPLDLPSTSTIKFSARKALEDQAWRDLMNKDDNYRSSTIDAVLDDIEAHLADGARGGFLVYSQFLRVLDILEIGIRKRFGRRCLRRTGRSTAAEKVDVMNKFKARYYSDYPNIDHAIMLMTPTSGAEGLNVIEAAHVHSVTPAYNPFVDKQAKARPFRPGQMETVHLHSYIMKDSCEERPEFIGSRKLYNAGNITDYSNITTSALQTVKNWTQEQFRREVSPNYEHLSSKFD
jgi:SNF2 family DNA or RNA helicase